MSDRAFSALLGLLPIVLFAVLLGLGEARVFDGWLADSDCYLRLIRVTRLAETGDWYNGFEPLLNAPDGLVMHWTRPFDVLLLLLTLPGLLVADFATSLFWAGVVISPLLAGVTLGLLAWGALVMLPRWGVAVMAVMFVAQPGLYGVFQLGRPDHHSLHMALAAWTLALLVRWCAGPGRPALAGWAGLSVALAIWVGTEALLILFVGAAGLGLLWLFGRAPAASALWRFAVVFAAGTLVAIAAERPPGEWLAVELDRISLMHGVLAVAVAAGAGLIALAARRHAPWGWGARLATAVVAAAIPALAMAVGFPEFFQGPYGAVAPEVREVFLANVVEAEPLLARGAGTWSEAIFALGPIVFAIPYALWRILRRRSGESDAYLILLLALAVYLAGALVQIRLMPYAELAMVWLWAAVVVAAVRTVPGWAPRPWGSALAAGVLIVVVAGHPVAASILMSPEQRQASQADEAKCDWPAVAGYLTREGFEGSILSYIYPGPELAWRTGLGVVAAPYHRNEAGILEAHRAFLATPDEALPIIEARRVGLIVLCDVERGRGGHDWYVTAGGPDSLYGRLAADQPPSWARRVGRELVELSGFQVFTVDRDGLALP